MSYKIKFYNILSIFTNYSFTNQLSGMAFTGKINNDYLLISMNKKRIKKVN
jgi:hypothetical protein